MRFNFGFQMFVRTVSVARRLDIESSNSRSPRIATMVLSQQEIEKAHGVSSFPKT